MNAKVRIFHWVWFSSKASLRRERGRPREVEPFSNKSCVVVVRDQTAASSSFPLIYNSATTARLMPH